MSIINQLIRKKRKKKTHKSRVPALQSCPQKKGVVEKVFIGVPRKPNSARRKVANIRLNNGKVITCHIPGEGHNLSKHSVVLLRGGRAKDLVGVKYKPIRGKFDLKPVDGRLKGRSKYGTKK